MIILVILDILDIPDHRNSRLIRAIQIFAAYMYGCSVAVIGLCAKNVIAEQMNVKKVQK